MAREGQCINIKSYHYIYFHLVSLVVCWQKSRRKFVRIPSTKGGEGHVLRVERIVKFRRATEFFSSSFAFRCMDVCRAYVAVSGRLFSLYCHLGFYACEHVREALRLYIINLFTVVYVYCFYFLQCLFLIPLIVAFSKLRKNEKLLKWWTYM